MQGLKPAAEGNYTMMDESEPTMLSEIQHFAFCRRQWALIHIEQQWAENVHTTDGSLFHHRVHDEQQTEMRGDTLIVRGLRVFSSRLNATGICDVVEFHRDEAGIKLSGRKGKWTVYPVEYKKGAPKDNDADRLQLCGQAMCLEEMLITEIPEGSLFYGEPRRRERVAFTPELRVRVEHMLAEMRDYYSRGYTPKVKPTKSCNACSIKELCLPRLNKLPSAKAYLESYMSELDL